MKKWRDNLCGTITCVASEVFADVFLDSCATNGLYLQNVRKESGCIRFTLPYKDKTKILKIAEQMGARLEMIGENGLFVTLKRYRLRLGVPVGLLAFLMVYFLLSSMIWGVEVDGCLKIDRDKFLAYMAEDNIRRGVFAASVDCNDAEYYAEKYSEDIEKATVNLVGCRIYIQIKERIVPPDIRDETVYANIIASKDGEVLSADFFAGTPEVKEGDAVTAGQLLASGIVDLKNGGSRYLRAQARIIARTRNIVNCYTACSFNAKKVQKLKKYSIPYLFIGVPIPAEDEGKSFTLASNSFLCLFSTLLPIGRTRYYRVQYCEDTVQLDETQAFLICFTDYALSAFEKTDEIIVSERVEKVRIEENIQIESIFFCEEDIAEQKAFEVISE